MVASSAGMAVGLAISTIFLGSQADGRGFLWRGAFTGLFTGIGQFLAAPQSFVWLVVTTLVRTLGWFLMRAGGIDMTLKWSMFGVIGALTFQLLTGLTPYSLVQLAHGIR